MLPKVRTVPSVVNTIAVAELSSIVKSNSYAVDAVNLVLVSRVIGFAN